MMRRKKSRIVAGKYVRLCPKCRIWKFETEYYKDKRTLNGLTSQCKKCHTETNLRTRDKLNARRICREYMRRARARDPEKFRERDRLASRKRVKDCKTKACAILNSAVKSKKIERPCICSACNERKKITAHHPDYSLPLQVEWLCYECHSNN